MLKNQLKQFKSPFWLLGLVLLVFLLKGLFFAAILPIFQAPDEITHYFRTQYLSRQEKNKPTASNTEHVTDFSQEIIETEKIVRSRIVAGHSNTNLTFSDSAMGSGEEEILKNQWRHYSEIYPIRTPDYPTLYYQLTSSIEDLFSKENLLIRFFLIRIFSILIGLCVVIFSYLSCRKIGFSQKNSILTSAIISFQPMLTQTAAIINSDILLVFFFTLFTFGALSLLKDGLNWKNVSILLLATFFAVWTKGPGITLAAVLYVLIAYGIYMRSNLKRNTFILYFSIFTVGLGILFFLIVPKEYILTITQFGQDSHFSSILHSLQEYFSNAKSGSFTSLSYWGNFGSLDASISENSVRFIWFVEILAFIGIVAAFLQKKDSLMGKKYIIFLLLLTLSLQLSIRFFDWRIFDVTGKIGIGTPGRYFIPTIFAHLTLILIGLGILLKKYLRFENVLKSALLLMVLFQCYSFFEVIIYRYYL